jgi:hypothetical protein
LATQFEATFVMFSSALLRTADDVIQALRRRKGELQLSNAILEEATGSCAGHADKVLGPSCVRSPSLALLMALVDALGCGLQLVSIPMHGCSVDGSAGPDGPRQRAREQGRHQEGQADRAHRAGPQRRSIMVGQQDTGKCGKPTSPS